MVKRIMVKCLKALGVSGIGLIGVGMLWGCRPNILSTINVGSETTATRAESAEKCGEDFVYIPAGRFIAGSDQAERDYGYQISAQALQTLSPGITSMTAAEAQLRSQAWFDQEPPQRRQRLAAFCISTNLVTQAEYQEFVLAAGYHSPGITPENYQEQGFRAHSYDDTKPYAWKGYQYPEEKANHPVVLVSQLDAVAYVTWKTRQDGVAYRLPTAEEWEKAARGTDGRYFPWGDNWQDEATNWQGSGIDGTSPVGQYPLSRSVYGVEDMAGNVFEFTSTTFEENKQQRTVMKGCAWDDLPGFCRAAYRHSRPVNYRHILFGFRLVKPAVE